MIGVIGTGSWGKNIVNTLRRMHIEHILCNTKGEYEGEKCYDDWSKVIALRPDGVIIAANPAFNLSIIKQCALLGIPVMVEKPVALFLDDVYQMEKLRLPILVDYINLFNPKYQCMKNDLSYPIKRVISLGYNNGPIRHYNSLYDYLPHDLSMVLDLVPGDLELRYFGAKTNPDNKGKLYTIQFSVGTTEIHVKCGNGADEKKRSLAVTCADGKTLLYDDSAPKSTAPLDNVIKHFIDVVNGARVKIPFAHTIKIHETLNQLGQWEKDK